MPFSRGANTAYNGSKTTQRGGGGVGGEGVGGEVVLGAVPKPFSQIQIRILTKQNFGPTPILILV